jgi:nuclear pore complex protein Nup62
VEGHISSSAFLTTSQLAALCNEMFIAEREQSDIEQSLEHIEQQQRDLLATLEVYEKTTEETMGSQGGNLRSLDTGPADTERDKKFVSFDFSRF